MTIATILHEKGNTVVTVAGDLSVQDILELLDRHRIGAVMVMDGDAVTGVVSERDVVRCLHEKGASILDATARDIMTSPVHSVRPGDSIASAMALVTERRVRHLPVIDNGRLIGVVSIGDLVKRRIDDAEGEARSLQDYIRTA